jgi:hypothetical protein
MHRIIAILILSYYSFGTLCLPSGNFSSLTDLPEMYRHCKTTEDKDMTPFDFVTDHLLNLDGLFDKHDDGDDQKPHQPFHFHHMMQQVVSPAFEFSMELEKHIFIEKKQTLFTTNFYHADYVSKIFRPPIV